MASAVEMDVKWPSGDRWLRGETGEVGPRGERVCRAGRRVIKRKGGYEAGSVSGVQWDRGGISRPNTFSICTS